ncbi:hypothetical protein QCA50_000941 [Cerrena zonata]|uniref:ferric-chelate reductase (NADPH) n=1 Tax=Cerrena zonata TaxID=2478898 RepID=A0AAW0GVR1_9APHY
MGLIWLDSPVLWHSARTPSRKSTLNDEENNLIRTKFLDWYRADWDYAQTTVEFLCAGIAIAMIFNIFSIYRRKSSSKSTRLSPVDRIAAFCRYATARQFRIKALGWYSPPLAAVIVVAGMILFFTALTFGQHPYQWPNMEMGHSAPLATRSGWISIAIIPFMIAFATKVNWITALTGTSHEKLQVFHRWSALIMYVTSLIHSFLFIWNSIHRTHDMEEEWQTSSFYWTGVAALVPQTYLTLLSWGYLRNKYYETFKNAAGIFMVAMFVHVDFILTSWDYFWATLAIYGLAWLTRVLRTWYNSSLIGLTGTLISHSSTIIELTIPVPPRVKWAPGQHVFVRFLGLGIHMFSSHPFTVASLKEEGVVRLVFKTHGGVTKVLKQKAEGKAGAKVSVWVDGPYGGVGQDLAMFERVVFLAGGLGETFTYPLFADLAKKIKDGKAQTKAIDFVLAVRDQDSCAWLEPALAETQALLSSTNTKVQLNIYVTQDQLSNTSSLCEESGESEIEKSKERLQDGVIPKIQGRPDLTKVIHAACTAQEKDVAVAVCGPDNFLFDVRNAVADRELAITKGAEGCTNLYLHSENYGW